MLKQCINYTTQPVALVMYIRLYVTYNFTGIAMPLKRINLFNAVTCINK